MRRLRTARSVEARYAALGDVFDLTPGDHGLFLVPSLAAAHDAWIYLDRAQAHGFQCRELRAVALDLAGPELQASGRVPLSRLGAEALAARALTELGPSLEAFRSLVRAPRLPRALARTFADLRRARVSALELDPTHSDLAALYRAYVDLLFETQVADEAELIAAAHRRLNGDDPPGYGRIALLDVAPRNLAEVEMLAALFGTSETVSAAVSPEHPDLEPLASAMGVPTEQAGPIDTARGLERARAFVFAAQTPPDGEADSSLVLFSSATERVESLDIARSILSCAAEGIPFDRIGVLLGDAETYGPCLEEAFRRAEIPARFSRAARRPSPSGRALLALLACAADGLSADRFAEYLSFGEVPEPDPDTGAPPETAVPWVATSEEAEQLVFASLEPEPGAEPKAPKPRREPEDAPVIDGRLRTPARWERFLIDASVVGGRDRWTRRLRSLRGELEARVEALQRAGDEGAVSAQDNLRSLEHLERFALPLIDRLDALPHHAPWAEWRRHLEALASYALRAPDPALRTLADLRGLDQRGAISLTELQIVLHPWLAFLRDALPDDVKTGPWVGPIEEAAGRSFDVVFVPGLAERGFPRRVQEDPLLPDEARRRLSPDLPTRRSESERERARLRLSLEAASRAVHASWPRLDPAKGRPRVPSLYALELARAVQGRLPALAALRGRGRGASPEDLGLVGPARSEGGDRQRRVRSGRPGGQPGRAHPQRRVRSLPGRGRHAPSPRPRPAGPGRPLARGRRATRWFRGRARAQRPFPRKTRTAPPAVLPDRSRAFRAVPLSLLSRVDSSATTPGGQRRARAARPGGPGAHRPLGAVSMVSSGPSAGSIAASD